MRLSAKLLLLISVDHGVKEGAEEEYAKRSI